MKTSGAVLVLATMWAGLALGIRAGARSTPRPPPARVKATNDSFRVEAGGRVALAPALLEVVQRNFAGFRVAARTDFSPRFWQDLQQDAAANPEVRRPFVPFAVRGDFNGDGRLDAAVVLTRRRLQWRVVAFHQTANGAFRPYILDHWNASAPSAIDNCFLQPEPRASLPDLGIPHTGKGRRVWAQWKHDAVCLTYPDVERSLIYYFDGARYHTLKVGDGDWGVDE